MGIRSRLLALSALGALLTIAVGLVAMIALHRAAAVGLRMDHQAQIHELAARVGAQALRLRRYEKDILLAAATPATAAEYRRRFVEADEDLRRLLGELEQQVDTDEGRRLVGDLRRNLDAYDLAVAGTYGAIAKGMHDPKQGPPKIARSAEFEMRAIESATESLIVRARERQAAGSQELNRLSTELAQKLAIAASVLALFAMLVGGSVNRSIARPLTRTLRVLEAVAEGNLDQSLEAGRTDEMGRIANCLNAAIVRMRHDRAEIERLAATDVLTGLPNRRAFTESIQNEIARARRYGYPCSLMLFDIDHFKKINDGFGHAVGDVVLARVGKLVRAQLRTSDMPARWGGEEFVIVLPHADLDGGAVVAARIRIAIQELEIVTDKGEKVPVTVSIGVSELTRDDTLHSLVERADHAMYAAKSGGRNRVMVNDGTVNSMPPPKSLRVVR